MQPYTEREVRHLFYAKIKEQCDYWKKQKGVDKMEGLVYSILEIFDGNTDLPMMNISLAPAPESKNDRQEAGEKYFVPQMFINDIMMSDEWLGFEHDSK